MASEQKEYDLATLIQKLSELVALLSRGQMPNTVFSRPADASSYDSLAFSSNALMQGFVDKYTRAMARQLDDQRIGAISASFGKQSAMAAFAVHKAMDFSPVFTRNMLGHYGAYEATEMLLRGANGMAYGMGRAMGGLTDPMQLNRNVSIAVAQGSLAYRNNFNNDGSVNFDYTHGLSLPQTAMLSRAILSNRSQYNAWAADQLNTGRDGLSAGEINNLRNGVGVTDRAASSFNRHMKRFQEQINGLVASISKMTGSVEGAVDFLQQATNGQAFSAGPAADRLRNKAAVLAANLRIAAADAGISSQEIFSMAGGYDALFRREKGMSPLEAMFGETASTAPIGSLAATAFAQWAKAHPGAGAMEQARAQESLNQRVSSYATGDAVNYNVILAHAVETGLIGKDVAVGLAASGDENQKKYALSNIYGKAGLQNMLKDRIAMEGYKRQHAGLIGELHGVSLAEGIDNEASMKGSYNLMESARNVAANLLDPTRKKGLRRELNRMYTSALTSDEALAAAGLEEDEIAAFQERASKHKWSARRIRSEISKMGGNVRELDVTAAGTFNRNVEDVYGDGSKESNAAIRELQTAYTKAYGGDMSSDQAGAAAARGALARNKLMSVVNEAKAEYQKAGDEYRRTGTPAAAARYAAAMKRMDDIARGAAGGKGGFSFREQSYVTGMAEAALKQAKGMAPGLTENEQTLIAAEAYDTYTQIIRGGGSDEEAFAGMRKAMHDRLRTEGLSEGQLEGLLDFGMNEGDMNAYREAAASGDRETMDRVAAKARGARSRAYDTAKLNFRAVSALRFLLDENGLADEDKTRKMQITLYDKIADVKKKNPELDDTQVIREALRETFKGEIGEYAPAKMGLEYYLANESSAEYENLSREIEEAGWRYSATVDVDAGTAALNAEVSDAEVRAEYQRRTRNGEAVAFASGSGNAQLSVTDDAVRAAERESRSDYGLQIASQSDLVDARKNGRMLGNMSRVDLNKAARDVGVRKKMRALDSLFVSGKGEKGLADRTLLEVVNSHAALKAKIDGSVDGKKDNDVSLEELGSKINKFLLDNQGVSEKDLYNLLAGAFNNEFAKTFKKLRDDEGEEIPLRAALTAVMHRAFADPAHSREAMATGYTLSVMEDKEDKKAADEEKKRKEEEDELGKKGTDEKILYYLKRMCEALEVSPNSL